MTECPYCGKEIIPEDLKVRLQERREERERDVLVKQKEYHAYCFMDIVNDEEGVLKRTDIMDGDVKKGEENGIKSITGL